MILTPHAEEPLGRQCQEIDPVTGAVCTRNRHVVDTTHWFESDDWRIQWASMPAIALPTDV